MIKAVRTYDKDVIREIMTNPVLWETIAEDGQDPNNYEPNIDDCWLLMSDGDEIVGIYNIHAHNSVTIEIHAQVFPHHRKEHAFDTGMAALEWISMNAPKEYQKIIAQIPVIYENVKRFTCSYGFQEEGINRKSYLKNGRIVDQWLLGITREEIDSMLAKREAA